ncbi:hypothetical protein A1Q1_01789 [Trichosporon asahii var. asahii CBS 2479]|uniref:BTB domain-containing protein n=1 Tax=Trichosporon asahii var. asahii (strain ATCC 90039 / CBS 2479 / JCM 2466 / KCTC 7840 / NBRC 103889/ NCYC 2677 / UAMH 7654) TaxID=1186058 RepID=J4UDE8_TRIAS|nr:hypothetical protein A1Q1_01789 [Trichosporon asahii var. asahii CBS 2479]EJT49140.1 hypothetical protein A1Q1_01789 [Trichosporon asahii var. asahii CBS 2479]
MANSPSSTDSDGLSAPLATMTADTLGSPSSAAATTNPANDQEPGGSPALLHYAFTSGDIEVVSSDDVHFRLKLSILQQHSPVFQDLTDLPLPPNSTRLVPFTNASALTLEILLCALDPAKDVRPVPSVAVFHQLCGLIDAYDISLVGNGVVAAVELSGLDLCLKYRFACSHNPERKKYWAMGCLSDHHFFASRSTDARLLKADYSNALDTFWEAFKDRQVGGKDCFNKKCWASYCGTFAAFRGQWKDVKSDIADALFNALKEVPLCSGRAVVISVIGGQISCDRCRTRLTKHGLHYWDRLVASGQWVSDDAAES